MDIISPYGKNVDNELSKIYGISSIEELQERVAKQLDQVYGLTVHHFDSLHIAYGMCLRINTHRGNYYLKFTSGGITDPVAFVSIASFLREKGLPLPEILNTKNGEEYFSLLDNTPYNVTYLMMAMPGKPVTGNTERQVENYARVMADFHSLGEEYLESHPRNISDDSSLFTIPKQIHNELPKLQSDLSAFGDVFSSHEVSLLANAFHHLENRLEAIARVGFKKTIIHGDFRLCHVLEENDKITGIIDFDQTGYAERLIDVCFGIISSPEPNSAKALSLGQQQHFLVAYHQRYPFTEEELSILADLLVWTNLDQLRDMCKFSHVLNRKIDQLKTSASLNEIYELMHSKVIDLDSHN